MFKKAFFNTVLYGLGPQIPKLAGLLILPIISQDLSSKDFGYYGIVLAYTQAVIYLRTLGLDIVLTNTYFKHPRLFRLRWCHISGLQQLWSIFLGVALFFILLGVLDNNSEKIEVAVLASLPVILFSTTEGIFFRLYQLRQKATPIAIRLIITGLINVIVTYLTIHNLQLGYKGWFYASFISSCVGFFWMFYPVYIKERLIPILKLRPRYLRGSLEISLPVLPHYYGVYLIGASDKVQLDVMGVNKNFIGHYNAAGLISNYASLLANASKNAVGPMFQKLLAERRFLDGKRLIEAWQISILLLTSLLSIWSRDIISFLIRTKDLPSIYYMSIWLVMAVNYAPMYVGANSQLFFYEKTSGLWRRALVAFVLNMILNVVLYHYFNILGVAISTFITYVFFGYSTFLMKDYIDSKVIDLNPVRWILVTIACTYLVILISDQTLLFRFLFSTFVIVLLLIFLPKWFAFRRDFKNPSSKNSQ